jgi:hypothetical protein
MITHPLDSLRQPKFIGKGQERLQLRELLQAAEFLHTWTVTELLSHTLQILALVAHIAIL